MCTCTHGINCNLAPTPVPDLYPWLQVGVGGSAGIKMTSWCTSLTRCTTGNFLEVSSQHDRKAGILFVACKCWGMGSGGKIIRYGIYISFTSGNLSCIRYAPIGYSDGETGTVPSSARYRNKGIF